MSSDNNGASRNADFLGSFELRAIVFTIDARLDDHRALEPQSVEKLPRQRRRDKRRRVFALLHEGILVLRPEQMEMGVGRTSRHLDARRTRMQIRALTNLSDFSHS